MVRCVAERIAGAAKQIKGLIDASVARIGEGARRADETGRIILETVGAVREVTRLSARSPASAAQSAGPTRSTRALNQLDEVTQRNARWSRRPALRRRLRGSGQGDGAPGGGSGTGNRGGTGGEATGVSARALAAAPAATRPAPRPALPADPRPGYVALPATPGRGHRRRQRRRLEAAPDHGHLFAPGLSILTRMKKRGEVSVHGFAVRGAVLPADVRGAHRPESSPTWPRQRWRPISSRRSACNRSRPGAA